MYLLVSDVGILLHVICSCNIWIDVQSWRMNVHNTGNRLED